MEEQLQQQEKRIRLLENLIFVLIKSDKYYFSKHLVFADGMNISANTGTGTKIGTATGQKIGLWNVVPVIQPASGSQAAVSGTADSTYSANEVTLINDIVTLVNELRQNLVSIGAIKGSS